MSGSTWLAIEVVIFAALAVGFIAWVVHVRRHPLPPRMKPWMAGVADYFRMAKGLVRSFVTGVFLFLLAGAQLCISRSRLQ